jgi:hypothetical protein
LPQFQGQSIAPRDTGSRIPYFSEVRAVPRLLRMANGRITIEKAGHVATVVIDNPGKRNAMSQAMWIAMGDAIQELSNEPDLRCIVLRGAGSEAFGSGADIDEFESIRSTKEKAIAFARHGHRAMHAVRDSLTDAIGGQIPVVSSTLAAAMRTSRAAS